jgi:hypothetical protein
MKSPEIGSPDRPRALFLAAQTDTSDDAIGALVAARLERQVILDQVIPPDVVAVLDEAVLHRLVGSPQAMHDALVHVPELSQRPYIVVQVVPAGNGANAGLAGAFDIAAADGIAETLRMEGFEDQTTIGQHWRKSSYSGNGGGNCVEVTTSLPRVVAVRDSKDPHGPVLIISRDEWARFISRVRATG